VTDTEKVVRGLLDFLGEPWDPQVLDFGSKQHDMSAKHVEYTAERRAADGGSECVYRSGLGTGRREMGASLRLACRLVDGRMLRELGYE
jgi:hypothetical protein